MKPRLLFRAMRQSQRDKRIHAMRRRPRLLMPVTRFVDTNYPHTLKVVNCEWYHGIQNMIVPAGAPPRTRNIVRIDVTESEEPAYLLMQGFVGPKTSLQIGYRVEWNGKIWLNPATIFSLDRDGNGEWKSLSWNEFDWVVQ